MFRKVLTAGAALALSAGMIGLAPSEVGASGARASLGAGSWATPSARVGAYDSNAQVAVRVYLRLHHQADAEKFVQTVSNPASPSYHHYLSAAQFRARYSPTASEVAAVKSFLTHAGMQVGDVPDNNLFVPALGTAAQMEQAF